MEQLISQLFAARDAAHILHLRTRSFAAHMALGELYDALVDLADALAENIQGKYGLLDIQHPTQMFSDTDAVIFVRDLAAWAEMQRGVFNPADTHLLNDWDNVISTVYKAKYKLENLA
jgi:hypothetical protein